MDKHKIEDKVILECRKLLTDRNIENIAQSVVAACEKDYDSSILKLLRKDLKAVETAIENLWKALEQGKEIEGIRERIEKRTVEKKRIEAQIAIEENREVFFTTEQIKVFLYSLKNGNVNDENNRRGIANIFFNAVYLYDDRFTLILHGGNVPITINNILLEEINDILKPINRSHCVLLLDDAAHAFSSEQQKDFFDFFRQIKSRTISPKAAIYPGITVYSASFHVGHDAEEIDVWLKPDNKSYKTFMLSLLKNRLPENDYKILLENEDLLNIMCFTCFGVPRALINMVQSFYPESQESLKSNYNRVNVLAAVKLCLAQTQGIYDSLKQKLPMYANFIINGSDIFNGLVEQLKIYNKNKEVTKQAVTIDIRQPIPNELLKVFSFFQYAGLVMPKGEVNKGDKGIFDLYIIHYAALIERNAFMSEQSVSTEKLSNVLEFRSAHEFKRILPKSLLKSDDISKEFALSLPNCSSCGAPRISENAKFCLECGSQLKMASLYYGLINNDISELPLTNWRIQRLRIIHV